MNKMKMIIILGVLAVVSFGVSYGVSTYLARKNAPVVGTNAKPAEQESALPQELLAAQAVSPSIREKQVEDVLRELQLRMDACKKREEELDQREKRIAMAQEMVKKEAENLENLQMQLKAPLANLEKAQAELQKSRLAVAATEAVRLKKLSAMYEKMDPPVGWQKLDGMCQNKQEDDVAKILFYMSEKGAAKLVSEIPDKTLAARLCDKLKRIKEET